MVEAGIFDLENSPRPERPTIISQETTMLNTVDGIWTEWHTGLTKFPSAESH
jgi:hypothetical protein